MGISDDQLVNPGCVSETLRCAICTEIYDDPVFSGGRPCQHVFCRACIEKALQKRARCPSCRAPLPKARLQPHLVMRNLLDELLVYCNAGCGWTGRKDARPGHELVCPVKRLESVAKMLSERDLWLAERDAEIALLRARVSERDKAISEQCKRIELQEKQLAECRVRLDLLAGRAVQKDAQIVALQQVRHAQHLKQALVAARRCVEADAVARFAELEAEAAAQSADRARCKASLAARRAQMLRKSAQAARHEAGLVDYVLGHHSDFRSSELECSQSSSSMQVFVRELTGRTLTLKVDSVDTIDAVKLMIQDRTGIPPTCFYLTYAGKNLADSRLVSDYNISKDCTLTMLMRLYSMRLDSVSGGDRCDQEPMTKRRRALI
mmetsp:Transcript_56834/g.113048  ORF Transcript_56834/g.113048 Transcript_56834/m.113048 type:complete len:379 (+) Transcript_56834:60-1196(+)